MFNSPILDVAIGLVFVFLLYSLLATSVKEAIATILGLRATMLKKGISEGMLSDTPSQFKLASIFTGIYKFFLGALNAAGFIPKKKEEMKRLGDKFYDHPIIKNYGSSRMFPLPSYIPAENFSFVLIDILKDDFNLRLTDIAGNKKKITQSVDDISVVIKNLQCSNDAVKIKELLDYYTALYSNKDTRSAGIIDRETCQILLLHLKSSGYDIATFSKKLENWFNDSMDRVSGWYKRQVQVILFIIGMCMAILFNVDTIEIAGKLSTDKDARDKIVQLAIKQADQYKDDPRVKKAVELNSKRADTLMDNYQKSIDEAKKTLDSGVANANQVLAIGWDGYGRNDSLFLHTLLDKTWIGFFYIDSSMKNKNRLVKEIDSAFGKKDTLKSKKDSLMWDSLFLVSFYKDQYKEYPVHVKTAYVWYAVTTQKKKLLGFLITAFAICLGAPFWFDLLNKLVKLRGSGKKEETDSGAAKQSANQQPLTVNVNTQKPGEEAVG